MISMIRYCCWKIMRIKIYHLSIIGKLYELKQDGVFDKINAICIGNYNNTDTFNLEEEILKLTKEASFLIIKSNNFGHIDKNIIIPIGANVEIDTKNQKPIKVIEDIIKK